MKDLSFQCFLFVLPQPLYYMTVEFMKLGGRYASLFYPNPAAIIGWELLIVALYAPFFAQLFFYRRQLDETASKIKVADVSYEKLAQEYQDKMEDDPLRGSLNQERGFDY